MLFGSAPDLAMNFCESMGGGGMSRRHPLKAAAIGGRAGHPLPDHAMYAATGRSSKPVSR
jgi:hypothetical protein